MTFNGTNGSYPTSLALGSDGNLYGTTSQGGTSYTGTVFQMTSSGTMTTIYNFSAFDANYHNSDGADPYGTLALGSDGNLYGTTYDGGANGSGTVFKITPAGTLTTLYTFSPTAGNSTNSDGANPYGTLTLGNDGNLYGATYSGGPNATGTIFRIEAQSRILYSFSSLSTGTPHVNSDGSGPESPFLLQGSDGNFYGTTLNGGAAGDGTIFRIAPTGALTSLYAFSAPDANAHNIDGSQPYPSLIQGSGGNFYGATSQGGTFGDGTIYQITPAGMLTTLLLSNQSGGGADNAP